LGHVKTHFDSHEGARRAAGILGHHINRGFEHPNVVSVYLAISDIAAARAFAASADLRRVMAEAGVLDAPKVAWMTPVLEHIVWDRELPAMMVSHAVADFGAWLAGYKAAAMLQQQGGIIGHAVNRSMDDPNTAIIYHQAETHDTLKAFLANPALEAAMKKAGVTSVPQVSFVTGGWAKMY
jgi:quinol monooxygenase YgiN